MHCSWINHSYNTISVRISCILMLYLNAQVMVKFEGYLDCYHIFVNYCTAMMTYSHVQPGVRLVRSVLHARKFGTPSHIPQEQSEVAPNLLNSIWMWELDEGAWQRFVVWKTVLQHMHHHVLNKGNDSLLVHKWHFQVYLCKKEKKNQGRGEKRKYATFATLAEQPSCNDNLSEL